MHNATQPAPPALANFPNAFDPATIANNVPLLAKISEIITELAKNDGIPKRWIDVVRQDGSKDGFWAFTSDVTLSHIAPMMAERSLGLWPQVVAFDKDTEVITYIMTIYDSQHGLVMTSLFLHPLDHMDTPTQSWNSSDTTAIKRFLRATFMVYDPTQEDPEYLLAKMGEQKKPNLATVDNKEILITRLEINRHNKSQRAPLVYARGYAPAGMGTPDDNLEELELGLFDSELRRVEEMVGRSNGSIMVTLNENGGAIELTEPLGLRVTAKGQYLRLHKGIQPSSLANPAIRHAFILGSGLNEEQLLPILHCKESLAEFPHSLQAARMHLTDFYDELDAVSKKQIEEENSMLDRLTRESRPKKIEPLSIVEKGGVDDEPAGEWLERILGPPKDGASELSKLGTDQVALENGSGYSSLHAGQNGSGADNGASDNPFPIESDISDSTILEWQGEADRPPVLGGSGRQAITGDDFTEDLDFLADMDTLGGA